jgi:NADPH-dependent 2,4-dienoyl-CoA reductase/sulfur reductase-like enzyme
LGIEVLCDHRAEEIESDRKIVRARSNAGLAAALGYDKLIIATGAKPVTPDIPGIDLVHPMHTMSDVFKVYEKITSGGFTKQP